MDNRATTLIEQAYEKQSKGRSSTTTNIIITEVDLYITEAGNIAFLERESMAHFGPAFEGYVLDRSRRSGVLVLKWRECGACITEGQAHHRITRRV